MVHIFLKKILKKKKNFINISSGKSLSTLQVLPDQAFATPSLSPLKAL